MRRHKLEQGLPPYGPAATLIPAGWGGGGREGVVVSFDDGETRWTANVQPGNGGPTEVRDHPNGADVLVFARGDCWVVDPTARRATLLAGAVEGVYAVPDSPDLILDRQGLALIRLGTAGVVWHTRRLSWDGLEGVSVRAGTIVGQSWDAARDRWSPFEVELSTGAASLGPLRVPPEDWERLAT